MNRNDILTEVYQDVFYKCYISSLLPNLVNEAHSEFLCKLSEMDEDKLIKLHNNKELKYYSIAMIRNMIFNRNSPFNKLFKNQDLPIEEAFYIEEDSDTPQFDDDAADALILDIWEHLEYRSKTIEGAWYSEQIFKMYFNTTKSFRDLSSETKIPTSSIYHNVKSTQEIIVNKFKDDYDRIN